VWLVVGMVLPALRSFFSVKARRGNNVIIWASQVASAIGVHPYQPRDKALVFAWQKKDNKSYMAALQRTGLVPPDQKMKMKTSDLDVYKNAMVAQNVEDVEKVKLEAVEIVRVAKLAQSPDVDVQSVLEMAKNVPSLQTDAKIVVVLENLAKKEIEDYKSKKELAYRLSIDPTVSEFEKQNALKEALEAESRALMAEARYLETKSSFIERTKARHMEQDELKELFTVAAGSYGKEIEKVVVKQKRITENNAKFYQKRLTDTVSLGCKIDGLYHGRLVEIKARQRALFGHVPRYEWVQLQVMMKVLELPSCDHIETYSGKENMTKISYDDKWFNEVATPKLDDFAKDLFHLLGDPSQQDLTLHSAFAEGARL